MRSTNDAHARPSAPPPSFTDADLPAPSHAERALTLVAGRTTGSLGTLATDPAGYPYTSFVTYALADGRALFLISRLAEHTRNLLVDGRASLLVHETAKADPLANERVTLLGRCVRQARSEPGIRDAYLAAHPTAAYYADFEDFDFWALSIEAVRYIGGYGRMSWVAADDFRRASPDPLAPTAGRILEHMNADHAEALRVYARAFTRATDAERAVMTAIDRYGFEMTVHTPQGVGPARVAFREPLTAADQARGVLIALLREAESKLA